VIWNSTVQAESNNETNIISSGGKRSWADVKISSRMKTFMAGENLDEVCPSFVVWIKRTLKERRKSYHRIVTNRSNDITFGSTEAYAIYLQDKLDGLKLEIGFCYEGASGQKVAGQQRLLASTPDVVSRGTDVVDRSATSSTAVRSNHGLRRAMRRS